MSRKHTKDATHELAAVRDAAETPAPEKPERVWSATTLRTRAYGRVQKIEDQISKARAVKQKADDEYRDAVSRLRDDLALAKAELDELTAPAPMLVIEDGNSAL